MAETPLSPRRRILEECEREREMLTNNDPSKVPNWLNVMNWNKVRLTR
jgi:hypothetical protein